MHGRQRGANFQDRLALPGIVEALFELVDHQFQAATVTAGIGLGKYEEAPLENRLQQLGRRRGPATFGIGQATQRLGIGKADCGREQRKKEFLGGGR